MRPDIIPLQGGIDQVTIPVEVKPGRLISAINYEPDVNGGGYRRIAGIERFDGRPRPSDAGYYVIDCTITGAVSAGNTITGMTSGATAKIIKVSDPANELIVTKVAGDFVAEGFEIAATQRGTIASVNFNAASTGVLHAEYKHLAANEYRNDIQKPTGSGPIRGVYQYQGDIYCFRDNAGATACNMWKATATGWQQVTFGREIQFTNAVGEISEGNTVTGLTSGASAVVRRALLRTGTWTVAGVGTLVFDSVTGSFQNGESLQVGGVTKATSSSSDTVITLQPGGKFEFDNHNFIGSATGQRMYFVDGVNELHEFDGTRIIPIRTGVTAGKPKYVTGHSNHLFVVIDGSLNGSSLGTPYSWNATTGAFEIGLGDICTGLLPQTGDLSGGVLFATTERKTFILYGNDASDFRLVEHSPDSGGRPYTLQNIGFAHYLDAKGVVSIQTSQAFGGFQMSVMTRDVQPFMNSLRNKETCSFVLTSSNQYRLMFNDGHGLIIRSKPSRGGLSTEIMFLYYGDFMHPFCAFSFVDNDGTERAFMGGSDGHVYEVDRGTSFDGRTIDSSFMTVFNHQGAVRDRKRYRRTVLSFRAGNTARLSVGYDLSFGNIDPAYGSAASMSALQAKTGNDAGGIWDYFNWDNFSWDASYMQELNVDTPGTGTSLSIIVFGQSAEDEPYTIHTAAIHMLPGRGER